MTAGKYNLTIDQGSDFLHFLTVKDSTGTPKNLTGYTARASMRPTAESSTVYNFVTGVTTPATNGKISMSLSSGVTAAIPAGTYLYDLELIGGAGSVERLIHGTVNLRREITR